MNFSDIRKTMREKVGGAIGIDLGSEDKVPESDVVKVGSNDDSDTRAIRILEAIRSMYIKNHIAGSVQIAVTITSITYTTSKQTAISCDIGLDEVETEIEAAQENTELEKTSTLEKTAIAAALASINGLKRRAEKFMNKSYKTNCSLSESLTLTMPVLGLFDINVTISATVQSLLDSPSLK
jgi:hypothetical protein